MPMARRPNAIWLPLDAIDQDMFRKAYKRGACMQSTYPRLIGVEVPGSKQQSSLLAILTNDQDYASLQMVGSQVRWKFLIVTSLLMKSLERRREHQPYKPLTCRQARSSPTLLGLHTDDRPCRDHAFMRTPLRLNNAVQFLVCNSCERYHNALKPALVDQVSIHLKRTRVESCSDLQ